MAGDVCQREGCFLYDIELIGSGRGRVLRVFIDKEQVGAGIEDCSNVSKGLNLLLDVEDIIPGGSYNLEVSTPGIDRRLSKPWHFARAVGKKVWIRSQVALEELGVEIPRLKKAKQFEEVLTLADEKGLHFNLDEGAIIIPLDRVEKAKIVFEVKQNNKKKAQ